MMVWGEGCKRQLVRDDRCAFPQVNREGRSIRSGLPSAWRKSLFATLRHFSELQKALKNGDHHRAGHPSRVSRTHPSAPLTKGSRSFDRLRRAAPHGCGPPVRISGFLYWLPVRISCRCGCATRPPDPARTSAFCSPPPARHSDGSAHSTSQR